MSNSPGRGLSVGIGVGVANTTQYEPLSLGEAVVGIDVNLDRWTSG